MEVNVQTIVEIHPSTKHFQIPQYVKHVLILVMSVTLQLNVNHVIVGMCYIRITHVH